MNTGTPQGCVILPILFSVYMGSSSVLVLIGSHSLCNSFVVNQFLFFTPNGENSLCYTPKKLWEQYDGEKMFCLFFISKIYSHVMQKWRPKTGMAIPYCLCWKLLDTRQKYSDISNLFAKLQHAKAPESSFQVCWVCLCTIMMVKSEHYARFMTRHVMKHAFTSNLHKINNAKWEKHCCYK